MQQNNYKELSIIPDLKLNIKKIKEISGGSSDVLINEFVTGNIHCALICCEGMLSTSTITELILKPITKIDTQKDAHSLFNYIHKFTYHKKIISNKAKKKNLKRGFVINFFL